jgi:hypothetical protein
MCIGSGMQFSEADLTVSLSKHHQPARKTLSLGRAFLGRLNVVLGFLTSRGSSGTLGLDGRTSVRVPGHVPIVVRDCDNVTRVRGHGERGSAGSPRETFVVVVRYMRY